MEADGQGPCFVVWVEAGSIGYDSGLQAGDQILELDDQDVTSMSAEALRTLAKHSRTQPPTLGVVSRALHLDLVGNRAMGLGFLVSDGWPIVVTAVELGGPAQAVGMRPGDVILEANGQTLSSPVDLKPLLSSHSKRVPIRFIPIGKLIPPSTQTRQKGALEGSRVKRAKDLHEKMNDILGDDYEKKMAVVGVLKQYAEDRDVDMLARALSVILKTQHQRKLIRQIRPFIPPRQREKYDDITRQQAHQTEKTKAADTQANGSPTASHRLGQRRALQIVRENGSFGFVIKGSNPAYIETVDSRGPAERAGLRAGDFIIKLNGIDVRKCTHSHLVHLLKDSGTAPTFEILRCDPAQYPYESHSGIGSISSTSSTSSHADSDWMTSDRKLIVDKEGRSYLDRAEFLLTSKERSTIRKALVEYDSTCNIVELCESISAILDTPSKKTLWMFIMARLSPKHQEYCTTYISLPPGVLQECLDMTAGHNSRVQGRNTGTSSVSGHGSQGNKNPGQISSFQQQVEYLLTSRERSVLKKALQLYSENRNMDYLLEDLDAILDTPSKRTLWKYVIPLLSPHHQSPVRQRLTTTMASSQSSQYRSSSYKLPSSLSSEDDEHELFSKTGARKMKSKPGSGSIRGMDLALIRELEETRKVVQQAKDIFAKDSDRDATRYITVIPVDRQGRDGSLQSPVSVQISGQPYPGLVPQGLGPGLLIPGMSPGQSVSPGMSTTLGLSPHGGVSIPQISIGPGLPSGYGSPPGPSSPQHAMMSPSSTWDSLSKRGVGGTGPGDNRLKIPANFMTQGHPDSDAEDSPRGPGAGNHLMASKFSKMGGGTFNRHALTALKQLDAAVAAEVSDLENTDMSNGSSAEDKASSQKDAGTSGVIPPAPPPPPPIAPPLAAPVTGGSATDKAQMSVKRINWEKLDQQKVENTIWEQIGDPSDLSDVVKYLELEQYFSTKSPKAKLHEKKNEVCILNPKKSYNISILLGHLKLSLSEVKQALYLMDEDILTPELLRQLVAYAPNTQEMEMLDSFSGDIEELSQPDRFTYEMSRVPGYEQRLKSLVFKGNFQEKIDEMKEHLQYIRKASLELRHSKKLSKILELILAMGNYMNQGNMRVGEAAGFKIRFLSQLEITKTSDNKFTFLHVLAEAVYSKFPDYLAVGEELTTVPEAAKFSNVLLNQELQDLRKVLQAIRGVIQKFVDKCNKTKLKAGISMPSSDISNTLEKFGSQKTSLGINDRFQDVMGHFISHASDEIQSLFRLNANTMEEFQNTVQYFGEDAKKVTTTELFGVFADFVTKFEKAHRHNMVYKRHN